MKKQFRTIDVLTVLTGIKLSQDADFHIVMDHFFPGIMTIGCAMMQPKAAAVIEDQLLEQDLSTPNFKCTSGNYKEWLNSALEVLPEFIEIEGPFGISEEEIEEAFSKFR